MSDEEEIDDGGPAFPTEWIASLGSRYPVPGMSLRDWFAGQALSGFDCGEFPADDLAGYAYAVADSMIERRKR